MKDKALFYFRELIYVRISALSQRKRFLLILCFFILGVCWCYKDYIFGNRVFVFSGIANDSLEQTYPNLYRCAFLIENGKKLFGFDFARGYGATRSINAISIFDWIVLFGTKNLAYLMGINQILKIILSFILFYIYLRLIERKEIVCYIGAASYALCGHMILRQFWKNYSTEVVLSAFLLIALEYSISKRRHTLLPIALLLYCTSLGEYNSVYVFGLVVGYTIFRYLELNDLNYLRMLKMILCNISAYILAALGSFAYLSQSLLGSLNSDRAKSGMASFDIRRLFELQGFDDLKSGFIRTVSAALEGTDELFHIVSHPHVLESATFYCGIVILAFIPIAIYKLKGTRRTLVWRVMAMAIAYILFPNLRYVINGFGTYAYKISSFWITILMLYYGTMGMDFWLDHEEGKQSFIFCFFHIIIVVTSLLLVSREKDTINFNYQLLLISIVEIILLDFTALCRDSINRKSIIAVLVFCSCVDLFSNTYILATVDTAQTEAYVSQFYTDNSIEHIKKIEKSKFYRIEKKDKMIITNAGLVLDYNGLVDYTGGASMNDNLHHFLEAMNIARFHPYSNHYMTGLSNGNELYDILSVKYVTTLDKTIDNDYGLKLLGEKDGKKIYENCNALPIGFCYNTFIEEEALKKLEIQERRFALLDSCVLNTNIAARIDGVNKVDSQVYKQELGGQELVYEYDTEGHKISFAEISSDKVIELTFNMESQRDNFGLLYYGNMEETLGSVPIGSKNTSSRQSFVFTGNNISYFQCGNEMNDIQIVVYDRNVYYKMADQYLQKRKNSQFNCTNFSPNHISGTVKNRENSILYFSIPYDKGWNIYIDGEKAELLKVNYGFIGAYMEAGEHDIVLKYQIPYMTISIIISIIGIVAIVIWCVYWQIREKR